MMEIHLVSLLSSAFLPPPYTQRSSSTSGSLGQAQKKAWRSQNSRYSSS